MSITADKSGRDKDRRWPQPQINDDPERNYLNPCEINDLERNYLLLKENNNHKAKVIRRLEKQVKDLQSTHGLHPKVLAFARMMQKELDANEEKHGTVDEITKENYSDWLYEIQYHQAKLLFAMKAGDKEAIKEHLADIGNCIMFVGHINDLL